MVAFQAVDRVRLPAEAIVAFPLNQKAHFQLMGEY